MNGRRALRDAALYVGVWTALGIFAATQTIAAAAYLHQPLSWRIALVTQLLNWYTCGLGTPLYLLLVHRLPLERPFIARRVPIYLVVIAVCVVVKYLVWVPLQNAFFHSGWQLGQSLVPNVFGVALDQVYFLILLYAIEYYRTARARERIAVELEAQLSQAQLQTLRSQLDPHFLFNTLNSISSLMRQDVDAADEMLERLSEMLRATLSSDGRQEVRLGDELAMTNRYLDIMRVRFGDRLVANVDVDAQLLDERVPSFLLQPLVENTVRHGITASSRATRIHISATIDAGTLLVRVVDDGCGLPAEPHEGVGLRNTRRRLAHLYGSLAELTLTNGANGGTEVAIRMPRREGYVAARADRAE